LYLLDLVLTDLDAISVKFGAKIADHRNLIIQVPDSFEERQLGSRHVWHYRDANWHAMELVLEQTNWHVLEEGTVDEAVSNLYDLLYELRETHVPQSDKVFQKTSLPWLNHTCEMAIAEKHLAEDLRSYADECTKCRRGLQHEHDKYKDKLKQQIASLPRGSKRWWRLNKQLMHRQTTPSFFPPMRNAQGTWVKKPFEKANLFAECWTAKNKLPEKNSNRPSSRLPPRWLVTLPFVHGSHVVCSALYARIKPPVRMTLEQ